MQTKSNRGGRLAGIEVRHARKCPARDGQRCRCKPTYQAAVWSRRDRKTIKKTFPTLDEARGWRADSMRSVRVGTMRAPSRLTLREAAAAWLEGARNGTIRTRSGDPYKPSALRSYETSLDARVLPELGGARLSEISRVDLQDFADRLAGEGLDPSTIRNTLMPVRAIYRRALARGEITVNPTTGLELPAVRGRRERIASPAEAAELIAALAEPDRALWATAFYAGLRRGELMALRWEDVDLATGRIRVERSWDEREGAIEPKSRAGRRTVPIAAVLRDHLDEHKIRSGRTEGLVFGATATRPFTPSNIRKRAATVWKRANKNRAAIEVTELEPITLHEARHTAASFLIAAGVNAKAITTYLGHSSIQITYDRYGHLMPGNEEEAAALLDAYLMVGDREADAEPALREPELS
jgi:integrase